MVLSLKNSFVNNLETLRQTFVQSFEELRDLHQPEDFRINSYLIKILVYQIHLFIVPLYVPNHSMDHIQLEVLLEPLVNNFQYSALLPNCCLESMFL